MSSADGLLLTPWPRHLEQRDGVVDLPPWTTPEAVLRLLPAVQQLAGGGVAKGPNGSAVADGIRAFPGIEEMTAWRGVVRASLTPAWCGAAGIESQRYTLEIGQSLPIPLESPTLNGLRHALATLAQLVRQFGHRIPCLRIEDWPTFETRGVMLDVSRDRIPTMPMFREIIGSLAALKVNHLQLYTEHTFAYAGHETAWQGWSPITPHEMVELDAYAAARGIELAANQNCFGHLRQWLRHDKYAPLAETHGEWMFDVWKRTGPFSLCPTDERSVEFVRGLLGQLVPCVRSELINIGCDETYDVGAGRSKAEVERRGRAAVCVDFVKWINEIVRSLGKRSMFWADIALSSPSLLQEIPGDMIPLAWGYEPSSPFDNWAKALAERGAWERGFWVCPGTSSWRSIAGRTTERRGNIAAAIHAGKAHGAAGILICDWGDTGHWQQWAVSLRGIAEGVAAAWSGDVAESPDAEAREATAASMHAMNDPTRRAAAWIDALGDADLELRESCLGLAKEGQEGRLLNQSALFLDLFKERQEALAVGSIDAWMSALQKTRDVNLQRPTTGNARLDRELEHTASFMEFAGLRALSRRTDPHNSHDREALIHRLDALRKGHVALWQKTSRPGGLDDSLTHFDTIAAKL